MIKAAVHVVRGTDFSSWKQYIECVVDNILARDT